MITLDDDGNYRREHALDQFILAFPVYRVSDRSDSLLVSS